MYSFFLIRILCSALFLSCLNLSRSSSDLLALYLVKAESFSLISFFIPSSNQGDGGLLTRNVLIGACLL
ncbi:unnamed protein product [Acanthoscelides obtectus]|uniref:Secreted protein n=1 Tax=Acanthoscelides obtectus TaxID=200917 RepID=A0A9P0P4J3_ACAOB|nr:unnamed protein product [Acanthoscelides obtectus]CAK1626355.1 hypothetical protein AOBTE_LOCUS3799 [Acanthoscelides obtectus]